MNTFWCYIGYLVRSREHLYFSLTALDLLLVFFHFKNESTDLIYWYTCIFSPLFTLRHMPFNLLFTRILAKTCIFVWIYSSILKRRRAQFSIRAELMRLSVCVHFRCVCFSHSARLFRQQSRAFYMLALCRRAVLISSLGTWDWTRMHALVVMHRRTLYENVDSAKIKVPFYTQILIFYAWHRCIVSALYRYIMLTCLLLLLLTNVL